ncbi:MAG: efflux RND transporter periplasmic adaptor subunit [Verrucomicrobia bacterium]|nr:efflux RND transporter periplasmic adaptor subunit [Verrucomicrobiota bacterium]
MARTSVRLTLVVLLLAAGCAKKEETAPTAASQADASGRGGTGARGAGSRGGGGRGGARGGGGPSQPVEVINLIRRDLSESLNVVGSLAANETATIRPEMAGLIRSIHFDEGKPVKKGDLLVKIDDSELLAQRAQSQARHDLAQLNLTRAENLRETQSNTQADVDRARSEFVAAQADLALLRVRLERTEVKAPFDGVTAGRTISVGDNVSSSAVITTITDLSRLKVEFQVPERYVAKVRPGTKFTVKSTTFESAKPVQGEVYFVNAVSDRNTRSSEVKGYLTDLPPALKAGMFATIELTLEVRKGALTAPEGAIMVDQRGPQLVMVNDQNGEKVAAFVPVNLGLRSRGLVEVSGVRGELSEKQIIVAAGVGSLALFPGTRLEPRPLRAEFRIGD